MNIETFLGIVGAFGGLEALKWLVNLRHSRKKAAADAAESFENVFAKRVKTYEDSILFLQNQLQEKEKQFADLSTKYQESMQRGLDLTHALGEMKLKYRNSRCDRRECENRKPPFNWMRKGAAATVMIGVMIASMLGTTSCTKRIYVPVETVRVMADSTRRVIVRTDTILQRDSILLVMRGDTVIKEVWRFRDRTAIHHDTVFSQRQDSIAVPRVIEVERPSSTKAKNYRLVLILSIVMAILLLAAWLRRRGR